MIFQTDKPYHFFELRTERHKVMAYLWIHTDFSDSEICLDQIETMADLQEAMDEANKYISKG